MAQPVFLLFCAAFALKWTFLDSVDINFPGCGPPDFPERGGYAPQQDSYLAGDIIHYYCDTDTYMSGNFYRRCDDSGDWSGKTPFCDFPASFSSVNQTSTAKPEEQNEAFKSADLNRKSCSQTEPGSGQYWMGVLTTPGTLFRVSLFLPYGNASYQIILLKSDGSEYSCGHAVKAIESLNWEVHHCPESSYNDVMGVKIISLSEAPLKICEIVVHTVTTPTCGYPQYRIENGRLQINRKLSTLICNSDYKSSQEKSLHCIRNGIWSKKNLYCTRRGEEDDE